MALHVPDRIARKVKTGNPESPRGKEKRKKKYSIPRSVGTGLVPTLLKRSSLIISFPDEPRVA